jgi:hypothetical protein
MVKTYKGVEAQWSTEFLKLVVSPVNSATPLADAYRTYDIPPRTINDYANRERSPLKKLGRNAVLPADVEKQLHQRIVRLKHVDFVLI